MLMGSIECFLRVQGEFHYLILIWRKKIENERVDMAYCSKEKSYASHIFDVVLLMDVQDAFFVNLLLF